MKNIQVTNTFVRDEYITILFVLLIYINYFCNYFMIKYFFLDVFLYSAFIGTLLMKNATSSIQSYPSNLAWLFGLNDKQNDIKEATNVCQNQECEKIGIENSYSN